MNDRKRQIKAIHRLLINMRIAIFEAKPHKELFELIDDIEILPAMLLEEDFQEDQFDLFLKGYCEKYNYEGVWIEYQKTNA